MPIYSYNGQFPRIGANCYIAPTASIIGDVTIKEGASVWFGCVLRGDVAPIIVGARSNIQDNSVIHGEAGCPTIIGEEVTVGHCAIVHAATIADRVLVGMGAVLLSRCRIGEYSIIGARALVTEDIDIPAGSLAIGMPARIRRSLTDDDRELIVHSAKHYVEHGLVYLADTASREPGYTKSGYNSSTTDKCIPRDGW